MHPQHRENCLASCTRSSIITVLLLTSGAHDGVDTKVMDSPFAKLDSRP
jgi:hypothetical protein